MVLSAVKAIQSPRTLPLHTLARCVFNQTCNQHRLGYFDPAGFAVCVCTLLAQGLVFDSGVTAFQT